MEKLNICLEATDYFILTVQAGKEFVKRWIFLNYDRKQKKILEQMRKFRQKFEFHDYSQTALNFRISITNRYLLKTI